MSSNYTVARVSQRYNDSRIYREYHILRRIHDGTLATYDTTTSKQDALNNSDFATWSEAKALLNTGGPTMLEQTEYSAHWILVRR